MLSASERHKPKKRHALIWCCFCLSWKTDITLYISDIFSSFLWIPLPWPLPLLSPWSVRALAHYVKKQQVAEFKSFEMWIETAAPNHQHKLGLRASQFHPSSAWNFEFPERRSNGSSSQWDLWYMDTHLARAFCIGIYAWQHTWCHLLSRWTLCNP